MQDEDVFAERSPPHSNVPAPSQPPPPPPPAVASKHTLANRSAQDTHVTGNSNAVHESAAAVSGQSPRSPLRRKDTAPADIPTMPKPQISNTTTTAAMTTTASSSSSLPPPPPSLATAADAPAARSQHTQLTLLPLLHAETSPPQHHSNSNNNSLHGSECEAPRLPRQYLLRHRMGYSVVRLNKRQRKHYTQAKVEEFLFYKEQKYNAVNVLSRFCAFVVLVLSFAVFAQVFSVSSTSWALVRYDDTHYSAGLFASCEGDTHVPCHHRRRTGRTLTLVDSVTSDVVCEVTSGFVRRYVAAMWTVGIVQLVALLSIAVVVLYIAQRPTRSGAMLLLFGLLLVTMACGVVNSVLFPRFSRCERQTCAARHEGKPSCVAQYQWAYKLYIAATALLALCWGLTLCMYSYVVNIRTNATVQLCRVRQERRLGKQSQAASVVSGQREAYEDEDEYDDEEVLRRAATMTAGEYSLTERPQRETLVHSATLPPRRTLHPDDFHTYSSNVQSSAADWRNEHCTQNGGHAIHDAGPPPHPPPIHYYGYMSNKRGLGGNVTLNGAATLRSGVAHKTREEEQEEEEQLQRWRTQRSAYNDEDNNSHDILVRGREGEAHMWDRPERSPVYGEDDLYNSTMMMNSNNNNDDSNHIRSALYTPAHGEEASSATQWQKRDHRYEDPASHFTQKQQEEHPQEQQTMYKAFDNNNYYYLGSDAQLQLPLPSVHVGPHGETSEVEMQDVSIAPHSVTQAPSPYTPTRAPHYSRDDNTNEKSAVKEKEGEDDDDEVRRAEERAAEHAAADALDHELVLNATQASSSAHEPFHLYNCPRAEPLSPFNVSAASFLAGPASPEAAEARRSEEQSLQHKYTRRARFAAWRRQLRPLSLRSHHTGTQSPQHTPAGPHAHGTPGPILRKARQARNYLMKIFSRDYDPSYLTAEELGVKIAGARDWVYDDRSDMFYSFALDTFFDPLWEEYYNNALKTWQKDIHEIIDARRIPD